MKSNWLIHLLPLVLCCGFIKASAQEVQTISLKLLPLKYTPKQFFINTVVDDRSDTTTIGQLRNDANKAYAINLKNGATAAITQYLHSNMLEDKNKEAINLHISQLNIEQKKTGAQISLNFGVVFYSNTTRIIEYTGQITAHTSGNVGNYAEQTIRQALEKSMKDFDSWWQKSKANYTTRQLQIRPQVIVSTKAKDDDIIVFSKKPLHWGNFTGRPDRLSPADAATYSGFLLSLSTENMGNKANATVTITPVFYKSQSWYKPTGKNAYALAHEQLHFNISGIVACELATEIRNRVFDFKTIRADIENLQKKYTEKQYQLQQQYDEETAHGINQEQQTEWQQKITAWLGEMECY